jgi:quercetin dioxygenase-like cupin family protein
MNKLIHFIIGFLAVALVVVFAAKPVMAQDVAKVAPDACKVILENDRVRVLDFWVKPGQKVAMHSHPAAITYFITGGKLKTTMPDGKVTETEAKAGEVRWSDPLTHANENIGANEAHVIVIELKEPPKEEEEKE